MHKPVRERRRHPSHFLRAMTDELGITTPVSPSPRRRKGPLRLKILKDGTRRYYR